MFHKCVFILSHEILDSKFMERYNKIKKLEFEKKSILIKNQESDLKCIIRYCYEHVPYYHRLLRSLGLYPDDIANVASLTKIPILTKNDIKNNWNDFIPANLNKMKYYNNSTGGTTGAPLDYRISKNDRFLSAALLYRGWGYGGYELGDKMIFVGGTSISVTRKGNFKSFIEARARNIRKLSSFEMNEKEIESYVKQINSFNPKYIYGYPSSINILAKWITEYDLKIEPPKRIFTTSEKLYPEIRKKISEGFQSEVLDTYGLNDGGLSAFECECHSGFHIDMERGILEVVNERMDQIESGRGTILATSTHNYAMPFIRYSVNDICIATDQICSCGRNYPMLKEIEGRTVDVFRTPEGIDIHGWFFLYIFWDYSKGIDEYQVIQEKLDLIVINLVVNSDFDFDQLEIIKRIIQEKGSWAVDFKFVESINRTESGKYRYIISKWK